MSRLATSLEVLYIYNCRSRENLLWFWVWGGGGYTGIYFVVDTFEDSESIPKAGRLLAFKTRFFK